MFDFCISVSCQCVPVAVKMELISFKFHFDFHGDAVIRSEACLYLTILAFCALFSISLLPILSVKVDHINFRLARVYNWHSKWAKNNILRTLYESIAKTGFISMVIPENFVKFLQVRNDIVCFHNCDRRIFINK